MATPRTRDLSKLLDSIQAVHKQDILTYTSGHLNSSNLNKKFSLSQHKQWRSSSDRSQSPPKLIPVVITHKCPEHDPVGSSKKKMEEMLCEFALGTSHTALAIGTTEHSHLTAHSHDEQLHNQSQETTLNRSVRNGPSLSPKSLYSHLSQDGVLVEELCIDGATPLLPPSTEYLSMPPPDARRSVREVVAPNVAGQSSVRVKVKRAVNLAQCLWPSIGTQLYQPLQTGQNWSSVTQADRYHQMLSIDSSMIRDKDSCQRKLLSGQNAVTSLEKKLRADLARLRVEGSGPNFHKLQVFSAAWEHLISSSPTFSHILICIKEEYDQYIGFLLDSQTSQHDRLHQQVEQMSHLSRQRPQDLADTRTYVSSLEKKAKDLLEQRERLYEELQIEKQLQEEQAAEAVIAESTLSLLAGVGGCHGGGIDEPHIELGEELQHMKALILEKLDALNNLRTRLSKHYVPSPVCSHLDQCIKETEVEVQKLLKQNEYFERSIAEMEADLTDAITQADTSERDARRIWRRVHSKRSLDNVQTGGGHSDSRGGMSDDNSDEEDKWNWYIS